MKSRIGIYVECEKCHNHLIMRNDLDRPGVYTIEPCSLCIEASVYEKFTEVLKVVDDAQGNEEIDNDKNTD